MYFNRLFQRIQQLSFYNTFKHSTTYFTGTIMVHLLGLVSLPVFTYYMDADEYGIVNVFTSFLLIVSVLMTFNLQGAVTRYFFEKDKTDFDEFLGTLLLGITASYLILGSVVVYFEATLAEWMNLPTHLVRWLLAMSYLVMIMNIYTQLLIVNQKSKEYSTVEVVWQYGKFGFAVIGLVALSSALYVEDGVMSSYTYMGKIIGEFVGTLLMALFGFRQILKATSFRGMRWRHLRYAFGFSVPLIPVILSGYILTSFDQWMINSSIDHATAGQYAFAYKIGIIYSGLVSALLNGAKPTYFKHMNEGNVPAIDQQVNSMLKLLMLGACFLMFFAIDIGTFLSSNAIFLAALPIAPVIVGSYVFHGIASLVNRGILYTKKNSYLAVVVLAAGIGNILLNVYYIPIYGFEAAAYTTLVSYFLMMLASLVLTTYVLKLPPLPFVRILKYLVPLAIVIALNYLFGAPNTGLHIGWMMYKGGLFILLTLLLFYNKIGLLLFGKQSSSDSDVLDSTPPE